MKCKVCGSESGKYPLCRLCNNKKENGEIIKCNKCGKWHYATASCSEEASIDFSEDKFLYEPKALLISKSEQLFYKAIKTAVPAGFFVFPQINLAAIIDRTDDARFHNELFRNVDFLITDEDFKPKLIIEINDQTHLKAERKERDEKVRKICEEAGIPIVKLWTSYGINIDYIENKIKEILGSLPVKRVHHFNKNDIENNQLQKTIIADNQLQKAINEKKGCYIATCVYGNYDCPQVWTLRRYRDNVLSKSYFGQRFIKIYYKISPMFVKKFGKLSIFKRICKKYLDFLVKYLQNRGVDNSFYEDL